MAITFPASPTTSQIFTSGNKSWIWDGTTWLAYGASLSPTVLKVDATNARVGINNQSPSAVLDVQASTGTAMRITNTGTGDSFFVEDSASTDSTPFVIDSGGNVGIGGSAFAAYGKVNVYGNLRTSPTLLNDGVSVVGRAGGSTGYSAILTPTTLTASRTITLPDKTGTVALTSDLGLVLIKTQAVGSGVASVTVTDAFSAAYDNYKITYIGGTMSASSDIEMTIGGSTTGYYGFLTYGLSSNNTPLGAGRNNANAFAWAGGGAAGQGSHVNVEIMGPFITAYTKIRNGSYQNGDNYGTHQGDHRVAASYTSFALAVLTGTMTGGTIRVYGYRNS
jgi:hypothetical protein